MKMKREGFTLIEILLFGVIFTVVSIAFLSILVTVTNVETNQTSVTDISQQGQFLMQSFQRYIEQSSAIESPTSTSDSRLVLRMASHSADPTVIILSNGTVWLQESSSTVQALTSPRIKVTDLKFTKRSIIGAHDTVDIFLTLRYGALSPNQSSTHTLKTSIARVGAANFDSDIVPSGAPIRLGVQSNDIQSINNTIFFGGGNVGVGSYLFNPEARLHINGGGLRFTNSPSQPACDSSRRGLFWVAFSTSAGVPDAVLGCARTSQGSYVWQQYAAGSGGAPPAPAPTVLSIVPASATSGVIANITSIGGSGFTSGAAVKITKTGSADITGSGFSVTNSSTITGGTFDLTGAATGTWNVVVTNSDAQFGTLVNGFTVAAPTPPPWYNAAWPYRQKITIDYTKVSSTLTDFPVHVNLANMQSGFFTNVKSDGGDIRITKADAITEEPREVAAINTGSQTGELHFKADTLSDTTNTVFYVYYGNAAAAEPAASAPYGRNNVWDSNFKKGVWHLGETSGLFADSTVSGNNGTLTDVNGNSVRGAAGKVGAALDLSGDADFVGVGAPTWYGSSWTWEAWISLDVSSQNMVMSHGTGWGGNGAYMSVYNGPLYTTVNQSQVVDSASLPTGSWQKVVATNSNNTLRLYRNGIKVGGPTALNNPLAPTNNFEIGRFNTGIQYWNGKIDEVRLSDSARSHQWILTEYNNQSSSSAFYTISSQETSP